jgi:DNA-binding Lrp family transcriptional regulator
MQVNFYYKEVNLVSAKAFILVETAIGRTKEVVSVLKKMEGLKSVDTVTGPYDIIAVVEAEDLNKIGDLITGKIHAIEGISRTVTCLAV